MKRYLGLLSVTVVLLTGCVVSADTMAVQSKDGVAVSIHGVNYTAEPFRYVVIDPNNPSNKGGGEHIGPFSAGGIVCCFVLPKQWRPGVHVHVRSTHWLPRDANGDLPEVTKTFAVEVPPYADGKVGELWVLRTADGSVDVVSSDFQPDHPSWPGKVKGWPKPSAAYQRERWDLDRKHAESSVDNYRKLLDELKRTPDSRLNSAWKHAVEYRRDEVSKFTGPSDPAYAQHLLKEYTEGLKRAQANLEQLKKDAP